MRPNYLVQLVQPVFLKMLMLWQGEGSDETVFSLILSLSPLSLCFFLACFLNRETGRAAYSRTMLCSWLTCQQHAGKMLCWSKCSPIRWRDGKVNTKDCLGAAPEQRLHLITELVTVLWDKDWRLWRSLCTDEPICHHIGDFVFWK